MNLAPLPNPLSRRWAAGLLAALALGGTAEAHPAVKLAAGPRNDTYWKLAATLRQQRDLAIQVVETSGSLENLEQLQAGEVDFALAQQDIVRDYFRDKGTGSNVRVVGRIFFDYLHIFVRHSIRVETSDLGRLKIWMGEPGSGTRLTASRFLDSLGTPISSPGGEQFGVESLPQHFRDGSLDAAMLVTTPGFQEACRLMQTAPVRLLSLDPKTLRELTEEEGTEFRKQTAIGRIPADTYRNQPAPVATIAVPVLLLAYAREDAKTARSLREAARAAWEDLATAEQGGDCRVPDSSPEVAPLKESGLEPLPGLPFDDDPFWPVIRPIAVKLVLLLAACAFAIWAFRRGWHRQLRSLWRQDKLPFLFLLLFGTAIAMVTLSG